MGAKQFSDALCVQHTHHYDELHLQYLQSIYACQGMANWKKQTFSAFKKFDDMSSEGFHGFVPSAQWLQDMYDRFIENHKAELEQHTAMLSAEICTTDHSHKIIKHIMKVNGIAIFVGLLTVTNEKGEIRVCDLVATKAHSQFELALIRMRELLELYGHKQPTIFYNDNMSDKQFLETSFPSLQQEHYSCGEIFPS
ncbi:hypothetical protein K439DRAFT_1621365 [Ramaria rubella]|nr:hypothetical protein K439DRAFT_1621365 [Ramaria rubella]